MRGQTHPRLIEYGVWGGGFLVSVVVLVVLGRTSLRLLQEAERKVASDYKNKTKHVELKHIEEIVT